MSIRCPVLFASEAAVASAQVVALASGVVRSFRARRGGFVQCLSGRVWATRSGDLHDHDLAAGDAIAFGPGILLAVQSVETARIRLITS
jgi:quercetin dioxygenase-like cupin family protein